MGRDSDHACDPLSDANAARVRHVKLLDKWAPRVLMVFGLPLIAFVVFQIGLCLAAGKTVPVIGFSCAQGGACDGLDPIDYEACTYEDPRGEREVPF
jgi:hypothetical protein